MNCKCGGSTTGSVHEVKTLKVAKEWLEDCRESDLPIRVDSDKCRSCGRRHTVITKNNKGAYVCRVISDYKTHTH